MFQWVCFEEYFVADLLLVFPEIFSAIVKPFDEILDELYFSPNFGLVDREAKVSIAS